jgi:hypothetical protein
MPLPPVPSGCNHTVPYSFELSVIDATTGTFDCSFHLQASGFTLSNGILRSRQNNAGYIASDSRLYFRYPFQSNTALDASFSICSNASLAFGGSTVFHKCFIDESFGIFNEPIGILCSPIFIGVVGTPIALTSVSLATVTTVTISVGSEAISSGLGPSETLDEADTTPTPTYVVEFDLGAPEDAQLVDRFRKTQLRHHLTIPIEKPNYGHNSRVCEPGRNKHHKCLFPRSKDHECDLRKCTRGHSKANTLVALSSLTMEETTSTQELFISDNQRRQVTSTSFSTPISSYSGYVFNEIGQDVFAGLSSYWSTPKSLSSNAATTLITLQRSTVPTTQPTGSENSYQSA